MTTDRTTVRSTLVNRTVAWVFGLLVVFVLIFQAIMELELDIFGNPVVRVLVIPGYAIFLVYAIIMSQLAPEAGQVVQVLVAVVYIYLLSLLIAETYRTLAEIYRTHK